MARNQNLDVLRGIAVLMVLAYHFDVLDIGWAGVDLFFVLSGFLIGGLLFAEWQRHGDLNIRRFYIRRAFKIYPAFYLFLATALALNLLAGQWKTRQALSAAFFIQNYIPTFGILGPTWSLAVEEHFYLILPPLLWLLSFSRFRYLPLCFGVVAIACLALRFQAGWHLSGTELTVWHTPTHLRLDSLFFGVLLAWLRALRPEHFARLIRKPMLIPAALAAAALLRFPLSSPVMHTMGFTILYAGFGAVLVLTVDRVPVDFMKPIAWIGTYSYSIYLWHMLFAMVIPHAGVLYFGLYLALSIGWGAFVGDAVEFPALALRDRLFPAPGSPNTVNPVPCEALQHVR